jgi:hypothetical protein
MFGARMRQIDIKIFRVAGIALGGCALVYGVATAALYWAMRQPPERFGAIMTHVPGISMGILPFKPLWMSARAGRLRTGDPAPDFYLPTLDHKSRVRISDEYRGNPVVLIFGSYT